MYKTTSFFPLVVRKIPLISFLLSNMTIDDKTPLSIMFHRIALLKNVLNSQGKNCYGVIFSNIPGPQSATLRKKIPSQIF